MKVRRMSRLTKKGISEIVSYAILIVIAISLSVGVYSFLKVYVPKEKPECQDQTSLTLTEFSCSLETGSLSLQISNSGLFKVDSIFIRFGKEGQKGKQLINKNSTSIIDIATQKRGLDAGASISQTLPIPNSILLSADSTYEIEIQPAIIEKSQQVLCNAIITQPIKCM